MARHALHNPECKSLLRLPKEDPAVRVGSHRDLRRFRPGVHYCPVHGEPVAGSAAPLRTLEQPFSPRPAQGAEPVMPGRRNRREPIGDDRRRYRERNLVARSIGGRKQGRRISCAR